MLNFRSGHLVEGGEFECEECLNVGREGGLVQTPEHWLGECEVLGDFWSVIGDRLGVVRRNERVRGRWEDLKERLVGGVGNEWLTVGWVLAVWVGLAGHWLFVFEEGSRLTLVERLGRWEGLMEDVMTGWWLGWGPTGGRRRQLVEGICQQSGGRILVAEGRVVFAREGIGGGPTMGIG